MEKQEGADLARRLHASGVPLSADDTWQQSVLRVQQIGDRWENRAFDQGNGATGYVIKVNVQVSAHLQIVGIFLDPSWSDVTISLLADPVERVAGYLDYRFYGKKIFEFERAQVLNHQLIRPELFSRTAPFQGLLLWSGMEAIPDAFVHGGNLPATVTFVDQFYHPYAFRVDLSIDRRYKCSSKKHERSARPSLFSQPDPPPVHSPSRVNKAEVGVVGGRITRSRDGHVDANAADPASEK
jgi:hypothetical protein